MTITGKQEIQASAKTGTRPTEGQFRECTERLGVEFLRTLPKKAFGWARPGCVRGLYFLLAVDGHASKNEEQNNPARLFVWCRFKIMLQVLS